MSFKSFQAINDWVKSHYFPAQLEALWQLLGQLRMNVQAVNMLAERYGSVYSTVEQTSYDSQGTATDVTSQERQTVPESTVANMLQQLKTLQATTDNLTARATGFMQFTVTTPSASEFAASVDDLHNVTVQSNGRSGSASFNTASGSGYSVNLSGDTLVASSESPFDGQRFLTAADKYVMYIASLGFTNNAHMYLCLPFTGGTAAVYQKPLIMVVYSDHVEVFLTRRKVVPSPTTDAQTRSWDIDDDSTRIGSFSTMEQMITGVVNSGNVYTWVQQTTMGTTARQTSTSVHTQYNLMQSLGPSPASVEIPATIDLTSQTDIQALSLLDLIQDLEQL